MIGWERALELVQVLAVPIGGWVVRQLTLILTQLKLLNGRQAKMEHWQQFHEQQDTERFAQIRRDLEHQRDRADQAVTRP